MALFESVGLTREHICQGDTSQLENTSASVIEKLNGEPDEEALLINHIKSQSKEQKA